MAVFSLVFDTPVNLGKLMHDDVLLSYEILRQFKYNYSIAEYQYKSSDNDAHIWLHISIVVISGNIIL